MRFIDGAEHALAVGELAERVRAVDREAREHGELPVAHRVDRALGAHAPGEPERRDAQLGCRGGEVVGLVGGRGEVSAVLIRFLSIAH